QECASFNALVNGQIRSHDQGTSRNMRLPATTPQVSCVAFSPDGKAVASGGYDGEIRICDPSSGKIRATFDRSIFGRGSIGTKRPPLPRPPTRIFDERVAFVAVAPHGKTLAWGTGDKTILLEWEIIKPGERFDRIKNPFYKYELKVGGQ